MNAACEQSAAPAHQRMCIACRQSFDKADLIRVVRNAEGVVSYDPAGKAPGRGAYVCSLKCFQTAQARKGFNRALKMQVSDTEMTHVAQQIATAFSEKE